MVEGGGDSAFFSVRDYEQQHILEIVQIDKEVLQMMFDMMEYQTRLIKNMYDRLRNVTPEKWLPTEDVAKLLSVSPRKVRTMKALGQLGFIKQGRKCLYKSEDVYSCIRKNKHG